MSNQNQRVAAQTNENLFALQEELDNLYTELPSYEGNYFNRAQARIANIEAILAQAAQAPNTGNVANGNVAPRNYNQDPEEESEGDPIITGGRRRKTRKAKKAKKTRKARKASKKTRRTRHKKYSKRR